MLRIFRFMIAGYVNADDTMNQPCSDFDLSADWHAMRHSWSSGDGIRPAEPPAVSCLACHQWWSSLLMICGMHKCQLGGFDWRGKKRRVNSPAKCHQRGKRCQLARTELIHRPMDHNRIEHERISSEMNENRRWINAQIRFSSTSESRASEPGCCSLFPSRNTKEITTNCDYSCFDFPRDLSINNWNLNNLDARAVASGSNNNNILDLLIKVSQEFLASKLFM